MGLLIYLLIGLTIVFVMVPLWNWITYVPKELKEGSTYVKDPLEAAEENRKEVEKTKNYNLKKLYRSVESRIEIHRKSRSQKRWKD